MRTFIIISCLAVLTAVLVVALRPRSQAAVALLPNGIRVEVLGTSVGAAQFSTERPWHKLARKTLPSRWLHRIPANISGSCSSGTNSITVFLRATDPGGRRLNEVPWSRYSVRDDAGISYAVEGGYCSFGWASNSAVFGLTLRAYPRRQSSFEFRLHDKDKNVIATLRVANPVTGPFPLWIPEPLPQTKTNGPVVLTLESFKAIGPWRYVQPKWKVSSADPAWAKARPRYAMLVDATGNQAQMLSTNEPAWKLWTRVHRELDDAFEPNERLVLTNLALPKPGEFLEIDASAVRDGVKLNVQVLGGPGELVVSNGVRSFLPLSGNKNPGHSTSQSSSWFKETWGSKQHFILVDAQNTEPDDDIRIALLRPDGLRIPTSDSSYTSRGTARTYQRDFTPPEGVTNITLEVIVSRPIPFEFLVDPRELKH